MFWHLLMIAAFNKSGNLFDNSTNGTSFKAPNNSSLPDDNMTKVLSNMMNPFQIFPFMVKRDADKDQEYETTMKNLSQVSEELTTTAQVPLHGTGAAKNFFDTLFKDIRRLTGDRENETNKGIVRRNVSEPMATDPDNKGNDTAKDGTSRTTSEPTAKMEHNPKQLDKGIGRLVEDGAHEKTTKQQPSQSLKESELTPTGNAVTGTAKMADNNHPTPGTTKEDKGGKGNEPKVSSPTVLA